MTFTQHDTRIAPHTRMIECEHGDDFFTLISSGEIASACASAKLISWRQSELSWYGNVDLDECLRYAQQGHAPLVARSDDLLAKLEDKLPLTSAWKRVDDVVGAIPNVPAFLAGHPQCMRRRQHVDRDDAPLAIFMDMTASAGISADHMLARGITVLALARVLVSHRAVELYAGIALGEGRRGYRTSPRGSWRSTVAWKIDTTPLDLARAAWLISAPAMARGIGYGLAAALINRRDWDGNWPFGDHSLHVRTQADSARRAFGNMQLVHVPPIHSTDELVTRPLEWIQRELAQLTGKGEDE
jgi:hypothetical protein